VLTDTVVKIVGRSALPAYEIIGFLGVFVCGCLALYAKVRHELSVLWPTQRKNQLVRSCLDLTNNLCVVVALRRVGLVVLGVRCAVGDVLFCVRLRMHVGADPGANAFQISVRGGSEGMVLGYGAASQVLTLTRKLVELHGGSIQVRSALGKGATFTFNLPIVER